MLSDNMFDGQKARASRTSRKLGKFPLPPWFASMERSMRQSILNLMRNAKPRCLKDGTINIQLAIYELTPGQIA